MPLTNPGYNRGYSPGRTVRLIFCLTLNESSTTNQISLADAAAKANWLAKFDLPAFESNEDEKFIPTPVVYEVAEEETEATFWEVEDYKQEMISAPVDISYSMLNVSPYIVKNMETWKSYNMSVYRLTDTHYVQGQLSGANLKPFAIQPGSFSVQNYKNRGYDVGSKVVVSFRLLAGANANETVAVQIADSDVDYSDDTQFPSLIDATGAITSPAVTGCVCTMTCDDVNPVAPATSIPVTGIVYTEVTFRDQADDSPVTLAASGSISQTGGALTVNEAALLTAGHTYTLEIRKSGYNIVCGDVVVPS